MTHATKTTPVTDVAVEAEHSGPPLPSAPETSDSQGWHVVLGENLDGRILCVDLPSLSLAGFFRSLGGRTEVIDLASPGQSPAARLCEELEARVARDSEPTLDGFVMHDLQGLVLNRMDVQGLQRAVRAVRTLLKPTGFCYLGFRNGRVFPNSMRRGVATAHAPLLNPAQVRALLLEAGFENRHIQMHPYLLSGDAVLEVLPERGYTSVKNSRRWQERLKEWIYGRFGAFRWAPGYGVAAGCHGHPFSSIDRLIAQLSSLPGVGSAAMQMKRCQILPRKVFISLGSGDAREGQVIVVVTRDQQVIARRNVEAGILERLARRVPALSSMLPRVLARGMLGAHHYFVLSEFRGMSIDGPCPGTVTATRNAAGFLTALHVATVQRDGAANEFRDETVRDLCGKMRERYPELRALTEQIEALLRQGQDRQEFLTVWQHGDFKLENVILDPVSLSVVGAIDWELSQERGLPLLDLLYLIAYNRQVNEGRHLVEVFHSVILPWRFSSEEQRLLNGYVGALGLVMKQPAVWAAFYMLHDLGVRHHYDLTRPDQRELLERQLQATATALTAASAVGGGDKE